MPTSPSKPITVTLSLPPPELNQNSRKHWRQKSPIVAGYRKTAGLLMLPMRCKDWPWPKCRADVRFSFPDNRRRDVSNFLGALKPAWDGFEDAGMVVDDRDIWFGKVYGVVEKGVAQVEITLRLEWPPEENK
jgi:Holliday junction resolvase RusA-like endonuclease